MPIHPVDSSNADAAFAFLDTRSPRGTAHWRWKYCAPASDAAPRAFCWREEDGRILGFIGLMPTRLETGERSRTASWFVDWHVEPGEKAVGIGIGLLRAAHRAAGIILTLQGSTDTQRILPRLGWQQSSVPRNLQLPLRGRYVGDYFRRQAPAWLGRAAAPVGWLARLRYRRRSPPPFPAASLVDVPRLPQDYDRVWADRLTEFAPAMARDSAYLNHLCADYPGGGFRLQLVNWRGVTVGHLITWVSEDSRGFRQGRIVDLVWPAGARGIIRWLVRAACWQLDRAGADYVHCTASRADLRAELERAGFRPRNVVPIWYARLPAGTPDPDTWYITYLDCDRSYR